MKNDNVVITYGPVPPQVIPEIISEVLNDRWTYLDSFLTGQAATLQAKIKIPGQPDVVQAPLYIVMFYKKAVNGEEVAPPQIKIGGQDLSLNSGKG